MLEVSGGKVTEGRHLFAVCGHPDADVLALESVKVHHVLQRARLLGVVGHLPHTGWVEYIWGDAGAAGGLVLGGAVVYVEARHAVGTEVAAETVFPLLANIQHRLALLDEVLANYLPVVGVTNQLVLTVCVLPTSMLTL